jgi:hypothetical protein
MRKFPSYISVEPITPEAVAALQSPHTASPQALNTFTGQVRYALERICEDPPPQALQAYAFDIGEWFLAPVYPLPLRMREHGTGLLHLDPLAVGLAATLFALEMTLESMFKEIADAGPGKSDAPHATRVATRHFADNLAMMAGQHPDARAIDQQVSWLSTWHMPAPRRRRPRPA